MKTIQDFIQEKYNPALNKKQGSLVDSITSIIDSVISSKQMSNEDIISMLEDILETYKKELKV